MGNYKIISFISYKMENRSQFKSRENYASSLFNIIPQPSGLLSPKSPSVIPNPSFSIIKSPFSIEKLMDVLLKRFRGTHNPVQYRSEFGFAQRWEQLLKGRPPQEDDMLLSSQGLVSLINVLVMVHRLFFLWQLSTYRFFDFVAAQLPFELAIGFIFLDLGHKIYLLSRQAKINTQTFHSWINMLNLELGCLLLPDMFSICYCCFLFFQKGDGDIYWILDIVCFYLNMNRFMQIYSTLSITLIPQSWRHYINIADFLGKLLAILHLFAIILYATTFINLQQNWIKSIMKEDVDSFTKYVLSLYFASTTLLTVGYGDILPKNNAQYIIIVLTQVTGIIMMGYIINEIGHALSQLRQTRQQFVQDLVNAQKIGRCYGLQQDLRNRMRNYLVNNQRAGYELKIKQQEELLHKLSQQLRKQVKNQNQISIIKTSLFFICNWSKRVQMDAAKKLIGITLSPNQGLPKDGKLYILTKGSLDLFTQKRGANKLYCRKHLKILQKKSKEEVFQNVFGYTSFFCGKPSKLWAISKQFSICYTIDYNDLLQIIKENSRDFQHYHRIRSKLQLERFPQKIQFPELINNRQNYYPLNTFVIKSYQKTFGSQKRNQPVRRHLRRMQIKIYNQNPLFNQNIIDRENDQNQNDSQFEEESYCCDSINSKKSQHPSWIHKIRSSNQDREKQLKNQNKGKQFLEARKYQRRYCKKTILQNQIREHLSMQVIQQTIVNSSLFECGKQYLRFYPKHNLSKIIKSLKNSESSLAWKNAHLTQNDSLDQMVIARTLSKSFFKSFIE